MDENTLHQSLYGKSMTMTSHSASAALSVVENPDILKFQEEIKVKDEKNSEEEIVNGSPALPMTYVYSTSKVELQSPNSQSSRLALHIKNTLHQSLYGKSMTMANHSASAALSVVENPDILKFQDEIKVKDEENSEEEIVNGSPALPMTYVYSTSKVELPSSLNYQSSRLAPHIQNTLHQSLYGKSMTMANHSASAALSVVENPDILKFQDEIKVKDEENSEEEIVNGSPALPMTYVYSTSKVELPSSLNYQSSRLAPHIQNTLHQSLYGKSMTMANHSASAALSVVENPDILKFQDEIKVKDEENSEEEIVNGSPALPMTYVYSTSKVELPSSLNYQSSRLAPHIQVEENLNEATWILGVEESPENFMTPQVRSRESPWLEKVENSLYWKAVEAEKEALKAEKIRKRQLAKAREKMKNSIKVRALAIAERQIRLAIKAEALALVGKKFKRSTKKKSPAENKKEIWQEIKTRTPALVNKETEKVKESLNEAIIERKPETPPRKSNLESSESVTTHEVPSRKSVRLEKVDIDFSWKALRVRALIEAQKEIKKADEAHALARTEKEIGKAVIARALAVAEKEIEEAFKREKVSEVVKELRSTHLPVTPEGVKKMRKAATTKALAKAKIEIQKALKQKAKTEKAKKEKKCVKKPSINFKTPKENATPIQRDIGLQRIYIQNTLSGQQFSKVFPQNIQYYFNPVQIKVKHPSSADGIEDGTYNVIGIPNSGYTSVLYSAKAPEADMMLAPIKVKQEPPFLDDELIVGVEPLSADIDNLAVSESMNSGACANFSMPGLVQGAEISLSNTPMNSSMQDQIKKRAKEKL